MSNIEKNDKQMKRRDLLRSLGSLAVGAGVVSISTLAVARVGRPATPASVAGVRRRTRRRTRRRVAVGITLTSLPYGCATSVMYGGVQSYYCGGVYYTPQQQGTTVVYVVDSIDAGADTNVEFED